MANGKEGVAPEVIARIEAQIEAQINQSDVGITVYRDPDTGKTTYHSDFTKLKATSSLKLSILGSKQQQRAEEDNEEEEEEEEGGGALFPAPQLKLMAISGTRIAGLAARVALRRRGTTNRDASFLPSLKRPTNEDAAFLPTLTRSMVQGLPKVGWCKVDPLVESASLQRVRGERRFRVYKEAPGFRTAPGANLNMIDCFPALLSV